MGILRVLFRLFATESRRPTQSPWEPRPNEERSLPRGNAEVAVLRVVEARLLAEEISGHCFVVDGDTIMIGNRSIRLAGIDAPELDHPYGKSARWALIKLCKGQRVRAVFDGSTTYERGVATCYLPDGRDLSAEMVKLGLAIDWGKHSGGKYRHLEVPDARKRLWRADARQKGRFPPVAKT